MRTTNCTISMSVIDLSAKDSISSTETTGFDESEAYYYPGGLSRDIKTPLYATNALNATLLHGAFEEIQENYTASTTIGDIVLLSDSVSDENGELQTGVTLNFLDGISSAGLGVHFPQSPPKSITAEFFNGATLISTQIINNPTKYAQFEDYVSGYTKLVLTLTDTQAPYQYHWIDYITFGTVLTFSGDQIVSCETVEAVNPLCEELPVGTCSFELYDAQDRFNMLNPKSIFAYLGTGQKIQLQSTIDGESNPYGVYYLSSYESASNKIASFEAQNCLGIMDSETYYGISYDRNPPLDPLPARTALINIMSQSQVELEIDESIPEDFNMCGYIAPCTIREAMQQACFAIGAVVKATRDGSLRVYMPGTEMSKYAGLNRLIEGSTLTKSTGVKSVTITSHNYADVDTSSGAQEVWSGTVIGTTTLVFDSPYKSLACSPSSVRMDLVSDWAVVVYGDETGSEVTITGYPVNLLTTTYTLQGDSEFGEVLTIDDVTTIGQSIVASTADRILANKEQYQYSSSVSLISDFEEPGLVLNYPSPYGETLIGPISKMTTDLAGGMILDCEISSLYALPQSAYGYLSALPESFVGEEGVIL